MRVFRRAPRRVVAPAERVVVPTGQPVVAPGTEHLVTPGDARVVVTPAEQVVTAGRPGDPVPAVETVVPDGTVLVEEVAPATRIHVIRRFLKGSDDVDTWRTIAALALAVATIAVLWASTKGDGGTSIEDFSPMQPVWDPAPAGTIEVAPALAFPDPGDLYSAYPRVARCVLAQDQVTWDLEFAARTPYRPAVGFRFLDRTTGAHHALSAGSGGITSHVLTGEHAGREVFHGVVRTPGLVPSQALRDQTRPGDCRLIIGQR